MRDPWLFGSLRGLPYIRRCPFCKKTAPELLKLLRVDPHDLDEISQVDSVLKGAGVDLERLAKDRTLHAAEIGADLARYAGEAQTLGLRGTPGFVIGRQLVPRALTLESLQQLVANARSAG